MKNFLKALFIALCVYMIYVTITTSLRSNLIEEWPALAQIPWMAATVKDFYINTIVIFTWIAYKERSIGARVLWLILLVGLGSIAVTGYILLQLFKLKQGDSVEKILLRQSS
jgi:Protein of unknown function (DUF1475)